MVKDKNFMLKCNLGRMMGAFNTCQLEGIGECSVQTDRNIDAGRFYDNASNLQSKFILQPVLRKEVEGNLFYFYERFDHTLYDWLLDDKNIIRTDSGEPTKEFLQIVRDILRGLLVLLDERMNHGNLNMENVAIKGGRAKLINISNDQLSNDCIAFSALMRSVLEVKMVRFQTRDFGDLLCFLEQPKLTKRRKLNNIAQHPIFLGPLGKLCYRLIAHDILGYESINGEKVLADMQWSISPRIWIRHVPHSGRFQEILKKTANTSDSFLSFLRYGRNVVAHANEGAAARRQEVLETGLNKWIEDSREVVVAHLESLWPGCLNLVHSHYSRRSITIPIDDKWLK